jgi:VIT1/CCC1 family predicted Fe2+/Mn2+ transporter
LKHHSDEEPHTPGQARVRDVILGLSDGLTVPFALAAGLSAAGVSAMTVVVAGLAEAAAGAISMGLGGYLAGAAELDNYHAELAREEREVHEIPEEERAEVRGIFAKYGLRGEALEQATRAVTSHKKSWVAFMMREELGLEEPDARGALRSGLTLAVSYVAGSVVPLVPYMLHLPLRTALAWSCAVTVSALAGFGAAKARWNGAVMWRGAAQTAAIGSLAAAAAFGLARLVSR